jgi:hypothetical protein
MRVLVFAFVFAAFIPAASGAVYRVESATEEEEPDEEGSVALSREEERPKAQAGA